MRNRLAHIAIILTAIIMTATSCKFRPLYIEGETPVEVLVMTDWTQLGSDPQGSTICFYPEGDKTPWVFKTNSVAKTMVKVPSGYYTVMVFNRTVDEYGTMTFSGMESLSRAKATLEEKTSLVWPGRSDTVGRRVNEPEEIVVGRTDHFYVRTESERTVKEWTKADTTNTAEVIIDTVSVTPQRTVYTGFVNVRVKGINNIKSVRAYLTGMAGTEMLATRAAGDSLATHVMVSGWELVRDVGDYTSGTVRTNFRCFGLPERYLKNHEAENNVLLIQFMLVDEATMIQYIIHVGDDIQQVDREFAVYVSISTDDQGNPIVIPDVKPKGGSESGFDVKFEDWPDEPISIPIGI